MKTENWGRAKLVDPGKNYIHEFWNLVALHWTVIPFLRYCACFGFHLNNSLKWRIELSAQKFIFRNVLDLMNVALKSSEQHIVTCCRAVQWILRRRWFCQNCSCHKLGQPATKSWWWRGFKEMSTRISVPKIIDKNMSPKYIEKNISPKNIDNNISPEKLSKRISPKRCY